MSKEEKKTIHFQHKVWADNYARLTIEGVYGAGGKAAVIAGFPEEESVRRGTDIKQRKEVKEYLDKVANELMENENISRAKVMKLLADITSFNLKDVVMVKDGKIAIADWDTLDDEKLACIQEVKVSDTKFGQTINIKPYSKLHALDTLVKVLKMTDPDVAINNTTVIKEGDRLFDR